MHQQRHWEIDHGHIPTYKSIKDNTLSWNKLKMRAKGPYSENFKSPKKEIETNPGKLKEILYP